MCECSRCGKPMNISSFMMNPVCLNCAKKNHRKVIKGVQKNKQFKKLKKQNK